MELEERRENANRKINLYSPCTGPIGPRENGIASLAQRVVQEVASLERRAAQDEHHKK